MFIYFKRSIFKKSFSLAALCCALFMGPTASAQNYTCGDADSDPNGRVNIADIGHIINRLFNNGQVSVPFGAGDPNCDGRTNIADVTYMVTWLFNGGPTPCCPSRSWSYVDPNFIGFQDGSKFNPFTSLPHALISGAPAGLKHVYLQSGTYEITADLNISVNLIGEFDPAWRRASGNPTVLANQTTSGVTRRIKLTQPLSFSRLEWTDLSIVAPDELQLGDLSNPLVIVNSSNVLFDNVKVTSGSILWTASSGSAGSTGSKGNNGASGQIGCDGCNSLGSGGSGGSSTPGDGTGGKGGTGGYNTSNGLAGSPGGAGARGGAGGQDGFCFAGGTNGSAGFSGLSGAQGSVASGMTQHGVVNSSVFKYFSKPGNSGQTGKVGHGGGGGGGGGGGNSSGFCNADRGGGGGGGGAGGLGGSGGSGGAGGGNSFAIMLFNSSLTARGCLFTSGSASNGGSGGNGGGGGAIGSGGSGGSGRDDSGSGGRGGNGRVGGAGGNGGGGAGGHSCAVALVRSSGYASISSSHNLGAAGVGGAGGGADLQTGPQGLNGIRAVSIALP